MNDISKLLLEVGTLCPTAPERIWLQVDPEPEQEGFAVYPESPAQDDVTWCADKINETDTLYIRADKVFELLRAYGVRVDAPAQPFFTAKDIALATMTPEQEAAAQQGWCMKCAQPSLSEKHREGGMRWLQCSRCTTVYALGVTVDAKPDLLKIGTAYADASSYDQMMQSEDSRRSLQEARAAFVAACGVKVAGKPCRYPDCSCPNRASDGMPDCRNAGVGEVQPQQGEKP